MPSGVHHVLPDFGHIRDIMECNRYMLSKDKPSPKARRDRQTIEDVQGVRVRTGLERFLSRTRKFNKMVLNKEELGKSIT